MTDFEKWFNAQFGGLPDPEKLRELQEEEAYLLDKAKWVNYDVRRLQLLQEKWHAALMARNAAEKGFGI